MAAQIGVDDPFVVLDFLGRPVGEKTVAHWLDRAMKVAGVLALAQDKFHGLRRKWMTERNDYPDKDVARAGGWRSTRVIKQAYQQGDGATALEVLLVPGGSKQ